jgi:hypothetical protein
MNFERASTLCIVLGLIFGAACNDGKSSDETGAETGDDPTGDGDPSTGDGDPSTGDGDPSTGDGDPSTGDGDPSTGDGDPSTGDGDDQTTGHGDGDVAEHVTIYEIQNGSVPLGGWVAVSEVWVTAKRNNGLWVQEVDGGPYSGVWVYVGNSGPNIAQIGIGDLVDVLGVTGVFNNLTEINALNGEVNHVGALDPSPAPNLITTAEIQAQWESVFVRVEGQPLTVVELPGFDEFVVNDGTGTGYVDDFLYNLFVAGTEQFPDFGVGATFTAIQGPLNFSFENYKIAPRFAADLEGYQPPG